jgi:hypothetical protein
LPEVTLTRSNPTVARIRLATFFRDARERSGRSLDELSRFLGVSAPQASRLDTGARGFRPGDVSRLAEWYGLHPDEVAPLMHLAEESRRREWWQQIDLDDAYRTLIGMEQAARTISEYCPHVIPGLLQTRDYASAAAAIASPEVDLSVERVERAVEVRMRRQEILRRSKPPRLTVVIDEVVLARGTQDSSIMRIQLEHLRAAAEAPAVTVQVIPFSYGLHPGGSGHFIIAEMGDLPDLVYSQGLGGDAASSVPELVERYRKTWTELRAIALDQYSSRACIEEYIRGRS